MRKSKNLSPPPSATPSSFHRIILIFLKIEKKISLRKIFCSASRFTQTIVNQRKIIIAMLLLCVIIVFMDVAKEMDVINNVVKDLTPLEPDARRKVVDVVCKILDIAHTQFATSPQEVVRQSHPTGAQPPGKPTAPQQYLRNYNYKIMTKRLAVLAVYLERERKMTRFNFKDITEAFRAAKEAKTPAPSQYARAVVMGYLAKEGDQYYATDKAEKLIDSYNTSPTQEEGGEA